MYLTTLEKNCRRKLLGRSSYNSASTTNNNKPFIQLGELCSKCVEENAKIAKQQSTVLCGALEPVFEHEIGKSDVNFPTN